MFSKKRFLLTTTMLFAVSACASGNKLPSTENSARAPNPIQWNQGTALPHVAFGTAEKPKKRVPSGIKSPKQSEMQGVVWVTRGDPNSEYKIPTGVGNPAAFQPGSMTLLSFDCPVMMTAIPNDAFAISDMGNTVTVSAKEGAPVGVSVRVAVQVCGETLKMLPTTVSGQGLSEARFTKEDKENNSDFSRLCSDTNYRVDKIVDGGPTGACTVVDATGANTATYITLPAYTQQFPAITLGENGEQRPARVKKERLSNGQHLLRIQGSWKQIVGEMPNKERFVITRGS